MYLDSAKLNLEILGEGTTWLDTGKHRSLLQAAQFVSVVEERRGRRICCPKAIAYHQKWINKDQLERLAKPLEKSSYGSYLIKLLSE